MSPSASLSIKKTITFITLLFLIFLIFYILNSRQSIDRSPSKTLQPDQPPVAETPIGSINRKKTIADKSTKGGEESENTNYKVDSKMRLDGFILQAKVMELARAQLIESWHSAESGKYAFIIKKPSEDDLAFLRNEALSPAESYSHAMQKLLNDQRLKSLEQFTQEIPNKYVMIQVPDDASKKILVLEGKIDDVSNINSKEIPNLEDAIHYQVDEGNEKAVDWRYSHLIKTVVD